ncbi:uncharacterized protein LOC115073301 [Rhinatrema bivittatum]|uniref:uncharacterized protein LOC115073301 n=1 Tax=Rhinatrema bivittatum TaxID=194408 RepID=UPI001126678B|nr:uncharacterized protein LOC115073301 [Rhinatrema bivittatum]
MDAARAVMPHSGRKRRARERLVLETSPASPESGPMDAHVVYGVAYPGEKQLLERSHEGNETPESLLDSIISLSPDQRTPPENPAVSRTSTLATHPLLSDDVNDRGGAIRVTLRETAVEAVEYSVSGEISTGGFLQFQAEQRTTIPEIFNLGMKMTLMVRPQVFTLETIWETLVILNDNVTSQLNPLIKKMVDIESQINVCKMRILQGTGLWILLDRI